LIEVGRRRQLIVAKEPYLTGEAIQAEVFERLAKYDSLSFLESYVMFMGKAQILEMGLKNLLVRKYGFESEKLERLTLGQTTRKLEECGLRADYVALLKSLVKYRNYIAHELLANDAMLKSLLGGESGRFEIRELEKGLYELEQAILLYDWCEEHNAWDGKGRPTRHAADGGDSGGKGKVPTSHRRR
jgi:hypothetical protein